MQTVDDQVIQLAQDAKIASIEIGRASTCQKNMALNAIADALINDSETLIEENQKDLTNARAQQLEDALIDRLALNHQRIEAMAQGVREVANLQDPIGAISELSYRPSGIQVGKMRVPLGVIAIIYESRPNVTADAAALCIKSGNACILRGGSESFFSNMAIAKVVRKGLESAGLTPNAVQLVETTDRGAVGSLLQQHRFIDVIVPRGGKSLIERIAGESRIPVIKHLDGICHVYIDDECNPKIAIDIAVNAKTHRFGVCNAMETLLVAKGVAKTILPHLAQEFESRRVELRGCPNTASIITCRPATESDWDTEYLAPILSIKVVQDLDEAMAHIRRHSSGHTESIVTENYTRAHRFLREVDSSSVMVNASTRFADGFEYGLGAEIGISTDKLHARGPVGLEGLTSQKFVVLGTGQVRQ